MVVTRNQMVVETRERMRGGEGCIAITNLIPPAEVPHGRLLAELEIPPGASIGVHQHGSETEYFIILSGRAVVDDNGSPRDVAAGDVVVTGGGVRVEVEV